MNTTYETKMNLTNELKNFGLDPRDWTLIKQKTGTYRIANKKDESFSLKGQTKLTEQKLTWDFIHLNSI